VAADCKPVRVRIQFFGMRGDPLGRGKTIFDAGWKFILGREAVVDRHRHASGLVGERAAWTVVRIESANDPSAAVEKYQHRKRTRSFGSIDSNRNLTGRAGNF